MNKEMTCIVCPVGCSLTVTKNDKDEIIVSGNKCKRGEIYAKQELLNPVRVLTSTVKIKNAIVDRIPVKTEGEIPKEVLFEAMEIIKNTCLIAPVKCGDIIIENICDSNVNLVATRSLKAI